MKKAFISFPKIEGFKNIVHSVRANAHFDGMGEDGNAIINPNNSKPTFKFTGTVKLHGTNAGVVSDGKELWAQSRKNIISVEQDNQGFAFFAENRKTLFMNIMDRVRKEYNVADDHHVAIYGEWCGKGIQKGVGVNGVVKMFVIFKIKVRTSDKEDNYWVDYDYNKIGSGALPTDRIYFIQQFPIFEIEIDFNKPEESQNKLIEFTMDVERQCPVAAQLGAKGIGEGIVWSGTHEDQHYIFKVKGEKHSVTKVRKLAAVDIEKLNSVNEFVEYAVTENRLRQAFNETFTAPGLEVSKKGLGGLIKWVIQDVAKEETDTLVENNLEPKDVNKAISQKTVKWFMKTHDRL